MKIDLLSIIVPVYKKEKTIKDELQNIYKILKTTHYNFEIIAVVDGTSLDKSIEKAKELNLPELKVYGYKTNKGKGQAVRFGMQKAKGDVIMFIDSGGDINPQGLIMLLEHMKWYNADIIVASKMHPASKVYYPLKRRIFSIAYYIMTKLMFGLRIHDTQTGLKAYKRKVLDKVLDRLVVKRFAFDIEILAVAHRLGFRKIYEAPVEVNWDPKDTSIMGIFTSNGIWNFVADTFAVWYRVKILNYYRGARKRIKTFDEELKLYVNTGDMTDKRQAINEFVKKWTKRILEAGSD